MPTQTPPKLEDCLKGLPATVAMRLQTEQASPLSSALSLSDSFWIDNPHKHEKGAARAARIVTRAEAISRCLAFYQLRGGTEVERTRQFFESTLAPQSPHDGLVQYTVS